MTFVTMIPKTLYTVVQICLAPNARSDSASGVLTS